jgi:formamidopyrimidine-DNA glycosylase
VAGFIVEIVHKARVDKRERVRKMVGVKMRNEEDVYFVEVYSARDKFCKGCMAAVEENFLFVDFKKIARRPPFFCWHHGSGAEDGEVHARIIE